jgi:hypothetical protein
VGVSASHASKKDASSEKASAWTGAAAGLVGDGGGESAPAAGRDDLSARRMRAFSVLMIMAAGGGEGARGRAPGGMGGCWHEIDLVPGVETPTRFDSGRFLAPLRLWFLDACGFGDGGRESGGEEEEVGGRGRQRGLFNRFPPCR